MATTSRKKDSGLGKERRGTSPSSSHTTHSQRSSSSGNGSKQGASDKEKSTTLAEKQIPNYLKPTIASSHDALRLAKKNSNDQDNQRLLRRRSFDKPPSASARGVKALISPSRRDHRASPAPAVPREKKLTVRSASFSGKPKVSSPGPVLDTRASKTPKPVKQPFFAKTPKKSTITSPNKKESFNNANASRSTKAPSSHDVARTLEHETNKQEENESAVHEVEETVKAESENEVHSDEPKSEYEEDVDSVVTEVLHSGEDEKINPSDISTCTSEDHIVSSSPQLVVEQTDYHHDEDKSVREVKTDTEQEEKESIISKDESCNIDTPPSEEVIIEEVKAKKLNEVEEKLGDDTNISETDDQNPTSAEEIGYHDDENKVEEKEEVEEGSEELLKAKEAVESNGGDDDDHEEEKQELEAASVASKRQGKKELPTAYNDVIEETASKLLEKRKNKVKALVGAFETVIDYESGASKGSPKD